MNFARISHPVLPRPAAANIPTASPCSPGGFLLFLKKSSMLETRAASKHSCSSGGNQHGPALERKLELLLEMLDSAQDVVNSITIDQFEPIPLGPNVTFVANNRDHQDKIVSETTTPSFLLLPADEGCFPPSLVFGKRLFPSDDGYEQGEELQEQELVGMKKQQEEQTVSQQVANEDDDWSSFSVKNETSSQQFRQYQADQWRERFRELAIFKQENGHCDVPHDFPCNPSLAQWVKRQRYQLKLKCSGRHSTLTDARQMDLEAIGFVWDAHDSSWAERIRSLREFRDQYGHSRVPSKYEDRPLAIWVKCQRRQMKLRLKGKKSTLNEKRISELLQLGFDWNPRNLMC